jgi:hypothetical protein
MYSNLPNGCTSSDIPEINSINETEINEHEADILNEVYYKLKNEEFMYFEEITKFIETKREQINN